MRSLLVLLTVAGAALAQDKPASELKRFEVATIKPFSNGLTGVQVFPGGRVTLSGMDLKSLVAAAFRVPYWQIAGGEGWTQEDRYSVEAKPSDEDAKAVKSLRYGLYEIDDATIREMLQALLVDRFQLKFHRLATNGTVYYLEKSGKPLAFRPTEAPGEKPRSNIGYVSAKWSFQAYSMPELANFAAAYYMHAPVEDRTALTERYDYKQSVPDLEHNSEVSFPSFITALGLKLEKTQGRVEKFVIDSASKPSAN